MEQATKPITGHPRQDPKRNSSPQNRRASKKNYPTLTRTLQYPQVSPKSQYDKIPRECFEV